ncbi:unnamed protein product [Rotaria sp. Silwood1]|nr:unnamed protein product [Rotaria sp. Silwood1]
MAIAYVSYTTLVDEKAIYYNKYLNRLLSSKFLIPFSKLSYLVYLIHLRVASDLIGNGPLRKMKNYHIDIASPICFLVTLIISEHSWRRTSRLFGTHGELTWSGENTIEHYDFLKQTRTIYDETDLSSSGIMTSGHADADFFAMDSFIRAVASNRSDLICTTPQDSLTSHILAFAAERARRENRVCSIDEMM